MGGLGSKDDPVGLTVAEAIMDDARSADAKNCRDANTEKALAFDLFVLEGEVVYSLPVDFFLFRRERPFGHEGSRGSPTTRRIDVHVNPNLFLQ